MKCKKLNHFATACKSKAPTQSGFHRKTVHTVRENTDAYEEESGLLQRTRERGVRLNPDKCHICVSEVSYFGHTLSHDSIKPDPLKVNAVEEMQPPWNKAELETVQGMINYHARFAPHLSETNAPLRQLQCKT